MKSELSKYNNSWYVEKIGASKFRQISWFLTSRLLLSTSLNPFSGLKVLILRRFGAHIGKGVVLKPSISIKYPWKLTIGDHSWIGENVWIDNLADVTIGSNVCISQGAMLLTGNHDFTKPAFDLIVKPVTIEDGAWIGAKAVVCPGVTARSHSVLTVASVATKDLEPYSIYQGNPAQKIKQRIIE